MTMSDRIAIMRAGRIVQVGAPRELFDRPATRFVADFLGKSIFLTGTVAAVEGGVAIVTVDGVPLRHRPAHGPMPAVGETLTLALRPHRPHLLPVNDGLDPDNRLPGRVESVLYVGSYAEVTVKTALSTPIMVSMPLEAGLALPAEHAEIAVGWAADATVAVGED